MHWVLWAVAPAAGVGVANAGHQALLAASRAGLDRAPGLAGAIGVPVAPSSVAACLVAGAGLALPLLAVSCVVAWGWTRLFRRVRGRAAVEVWPVVAVLFALGLPPGMPPWQAALGISFALVVGLEIFGGAGRNPANPALVGLAFLYLAYPASFSGAAWSGVPGVAIPTVLATAADGGAAALQAAWVDTLLGLEPGALGETSALACLAGAAVLVYARIASWRILAGGVAGLTATAALVQVWQEAALPWYWHLTTGSFAFGLAFLATDPVTSASTPAGRWIYGAGIGAFVVLLRAFNPALVEGVIVAILLGNVLAPLIDAGVVSVHRLHRRTRTA
jgi:Na+-transporting NADH:ubiquinone oxidoreductase subunit B